MGVSALLSSSAAAAVPTAFTYHGLLQEDGSLVNGVHSISAQIINEKGGVVALAPAENITVISGRYSMTIKDIDTEKVAIAQKLLLKIFVDNTELQPALPINSVPYSLSAGKAAALKTDNIDGSGYYAYTREGETTVEAPAENIPHCPCDVDFSRWDCESSFENLSFKEEQCYDAGGEAYNYYRRESIVRPLDVVAIENNAVGIGTTQPEAPLHILSDAGENGGSDLHIAGPNPTILLEDQDGSAISVNADNGTLNISGAINATAIGKDLLNVLYPVGAIYFSANGANPSSYLGGEWEQIKDVFLLAAGSTYGAGTTGGAATVTLSTSQIPGHSHSGTTNSMNKNASHSHDGSYWVKNNGSLSGTRYALTYYSSGLGSNSIGSSLGVENPAIAISSTNTDHQHTFTTGNTGGGQAHNNMPPYLTVYVWKRIQ